MDKYFLFLTGKEFSFKFFYHLSNTFSLKMKVSCRSSNIKIIGLNYSKK